MKKKINNFKKIPILNIYNLLLLCPFLRIVTNPSYDNDFWFTINQGRYIIEHGFPYKAINIIHDLPFIYQSWGSGVLFYLIYNYLGQIGIIFLIVFIGWATSYFYYKLCYVISNNKRVSLIITLITMVIYNSFFLTTRPHIFTTLNIVIVLFLLESYLKTHKKKYLYFLPLISLFEINMHGIYFVILLVICIPFLINSFEFKIMGFISNGSPKKYLFFTYFIMMLMGIINPYGYKTIIYGFSSYSSNLLVNFINELNALNFHNLLGKIAIVLIMIIMIIYFKNKEKIQIRYFLLILGTSYLAFDAFKSFNIFIVCSLYLLAYIYREKFDFKKVKYSKKYNTFHILLTIVVAILCVIYVPNMDVDNKVKSLYDFLDNEDIEKNNAKIYINFNDGSYAEWRGYYCYIDPRAEVFLKSNNHKYDVLEEYYDLQYLLLNYKDFLDKYKFDYLVINSYEDSLYYLLNLDSYNYYKVYEVRYNEYIIYQIYKKK